MRRRHFIGVGLAAITGGLTAACGDDTTGPVGGSGRLEARPGTRTAEPLPSGTHALPLGNGKQNLIHVPESLDPDVPAPLVMLLHGATGDPSNFYPLFDLSEELGILTLVPASRSYTWDRIAVGAFGPDVGFLDTALRYAFASATIDPARLVLGGFSDGATYALSLGLTNGDLFSHLVAFSPGYAAPASRHGRPDVFVSHGRSDTILPIDQTSRRIVPALERDGYTVEYLEFEGGHSVPREVSRAAFEWFTVAG